MPKMIKKIKKRKSEDNKTIKLVFDIDMVEALIKYMRCEYVTDQQKNEINKLIKFLNLNEYMSEQDILDRLILLKTLSIGICEENLKDESVLMSYIREHLDDADLIISNINFKKNQLSQSECNMINKFVNEKLQCVYIYQVKDEIIESLSAFDVKGFTSFYDLIVPLKEKLSKLLVQLQSITSPTALIRSFNFSGDQFINALAQIVQRAKMPTKVLMTGIRQLNAILCPGFQSGRFYLFLGGTGKFKSGTLWNIADQIRQFNPQIDAFENGRRKTILFITMENTIYETILRLIDMYNPTNKEITEMDVNEVADILRKEGKFIFTAESGIDIELQYYHDLEISTGDLYTIIRQLSDEGKEVIAVILDYILKINSQKEHYGDERLRLSYAARELSDLAIEFDIPVISAMQINREGNSILESTMQNNKEDVARFMGNSFVGNCWDMIQTADWVCFIDLEMQHSTGKWYLAFKRTKTRIKNDPMAVTYFNHPFENNNGIRLAIDVNKPESLSIISLASDLLSIDESKFEGSARSRPTVSSNNKGTFDAIDMEGLVKAS